MNKWRLNEMNNEFKNTLKNGTDGENQI